MRPLRLLARAPVTAPPPAVLGDPDLVRGFLEDAAHVPGGHAAGVAFPGDEGEVAALLRSSTRVLPVGAQSSLTGGATPKGEVVLSTRALTGLEVLSPSRVRVGAGVPLSELQRALSARGLWYPPVPTYEGAFVGGTIATNAAGAATFKYGATRSWVEALTVVLADGSVLDLGRDAVSAHISFEVELPSGMVRLVPLPTYAMPRVAKHSAGYWSGSFHPIDLFIGSEGTLGVIVQATLRVIPRRSTAVALIPCSGDAEAIAMTAALRSSPDAEIAGVEYVDARALACLDEAAFSRANLARPPAGSALLFVHLEGSLEALSSVAPTDEAGERAQVVLPADERGAARLLELREAVPAAVNRRIAEAKARVHADIEKTAGDMIVPFERVADSLAVYRSVLGRHGLDHAIWGHLSDGNLHPNVLPRSLEDVERGRAALLEIGDAIIGMGGSPLAEHGVGRNPVKQELMRRLYGDQGIAQMRAVKRALDPDWKLAPGVLFQEV